MHIGYLAAIVAASNAGGAGSVVGDTTTTMMWIDGVNPLDVLHAFVASGVALAIFGIVAAKQQHAYSPIVREVEAGTRVDWARVGIVAFILVGRHPRERGRQPAVPRRARRLPGHRRRGLARDRRVGARAQARLAPAAREPQGDDLPALPRDHRVDDAGGDSSRPASWQTALGLGFLSSVFDNIPLTALALKQGGYDWGFLAYAVGFGGSMIWFGSSAGVALSNLFPEARSVGQWLRHGWHVVPWPTWRASS